MKKRLLFILMACFLAGCGTAHLIRYDSVKRTPKRDASEIEIVDAADIKRPYKVIGMVEGEPAARGFSPDGAINAMKRKAAKMGGDALTDLGHHQNLLKRNEVWSAKVVIWTVK